MPREEGHLSSALSVQATAPCIPLSRLPLQVPQLQQLRHHSSPPGRVVLSFGVNEEGRNQRRRTRLLETSRPASCMSSRVMAALGRNALGSRVATGYVGGGGGGGGRDERGAGVSDEDLIVDWQAHVEGFGMLGRARQCERSRQASVTFDEVISCRLCAHDRLPAIRAREAVELEGCG